MVPFNRGGGSCRRRRRQTNASSDIPAYPAVREPQMRRWSHSTKEAVSPVGLETIQAQLHSLSCLLERQNRLLLELRAQLQSAPPP